MTIHVGPILGFQGISSSDGQQYWCVGLIIVSDDSPAPALTLDPPAVASPPELLKTHKGRQLFRYDIQVSQAAVDQVIGYQIGPHAHSFTVPGKGASPRLAYTSCNGFSALKLMKQVKDKFANWRTMGEVHSKNAYHLLVMGGDQVYADPQWEIVPQLQAWNELPEDKAVKAPFTKTMHKAVEDFYFDLYCNRWSETESARMFASVPTLMMWDDHDIFDGWGSYSAERQKSPVFQGIFEIAREHFFLFQRQGVENSACIAPKLGFTVGHKIGEVGILVLDLRSERTIDQVISPPHWDRIYGWMDDIKGLSHLLVVSSIPVLHPSFNMLEQGLGIFPGQQELEDDLRDHWTSRAHTGERLRLIHNLLKFAATGVRVTIVSGDVHIAAVGAIESNRHPGDSGLHVINQLTASGIVHPAPAGMLLFALNHLLDEDDEIDRGIIGRMHKFPGTPHRFIGKRNWLSIEPDTEKSPVRLWANWYAEGESQPYTKVIHPGK